MGRPPTTSAPPSAGGKRGATPSGATLNVLPPETAVLAPCVVALPAAIMASSRASLSLQLMLQ
ncbi:hypothetical protein EON68_02610 [archaeon]|nr:MAG: hypothetical protein EON68_02610 [archaeon]